MEYRKIQYSDLSAEASVSAFKPDGGIGEYHIIITLTDPCLPFTRQALNAGEALRRAIGTLPDNAVPVFQRIFLSDISNQLAMLPPGYVRQGTSIIGQPPLNGTKMAILAVAQEDMDVSRISPSTVGATHGRYRHLWTGNLPADETDPHKATVRLLDSLARELAGLRCNLADNCLRTWFFVDGVDRNYSGVVSGRNEVFGRSGLTPSTHFIASTGIGGRPANPHSKVAFDAYSVDGIQPDQITYLSAPTHLNPTYEYGVAFERATAIEYGDRRQVLVSGTASINNKGEIMHPGDIVAQTGRMLDNIEALLAQAEATLADLTHGIIYLRDPADHAVVSGIFAERLPELPKVIVLAPVCRPGWLIEMECGAIIPASSSFPPL